MDSGIFSRQQADGGVAQLCWNTYELTTQSGNESPGFARSLGAQLRHYAAVRPCGGFI